jgi:hypothetical protein
MGGRFWRKRDLGRQALRRVRQSTRCVYEYGRKSEQEKGHWDREAIPNRRVDSVVYRVHHSLSGDIRVQAWRWELLTVYPANVFYD